MKPRSLRHRFEKAAKLLVVVQKHAPDANCQLHDEKGEHGQLVIDFSDTEISQTKMAQLGKDLESKGYSFHEKKSPWLGQVTYLGKASDKTTVSITIPIMKDRVGINEDLPETPHSFANG